MKATGMVRKMDELGRLVLPMELRRNMEIEVGTPMEIFVDGDYIMLRKYNTMQGPQEKVADLCRSIEGSKMQEKERCLALLQEAAEMMKA